nr:D-glycero-beta-D-manno-heptose-7-phosphate kinase [Desulfobacterales bacterium]
MITDISQFTKRSVLVIGDLMIDEYLWGEVERISPEAPVQVVSVLRETSTLGGAGNVVNNLVALGAKVSVAGVIGKDTNADLMIDILHRLDVDTQCLIQDASRPTTKKTRVIAAHQQVLRIDREITDDITDTQARQIEEFYRDRINDFDILLISDYGKGLLTNYLLRQLIKTAKDHDRLVVIDPKGLDFRKYAGATIITPNKKEASLAAGIEIRGKESLMEAGKTLQRRLSISAVLITCGKDGMVLFEQGREPYEIKAVARQVFDVSGAGDTVLAVLGLGLASGFSPVESATLANIAGGIVVGKLGTAPITEEELNEAIFPSIETPVPKLKTISSLVPIIEQLKGAGKTIVMTNGCFDLLHAGHIKLLEASKRLGDVLVVAIDTDESVRSLKGEGRPVIGELERVRIISALDSVDYVVLFSSNELTQLIEALKPHILTKGSNYTTETVFGREAVERNGGRIVLIPMIEQVSSTQIINRIKSNV